MDLAQASRVTIPSASAPSPSYPCVVGVASTPLDPPAPTQADVFSSDSTGKLAAWLMKGGDCPKLEDSWVKPLNVPCTHKIAVTPDGLHALAAGQGAISGLDPATGDVQWTQTYGTIAGTPTVSPDGSAVVVVTGEGTIVSLDTATGEKKWESPLGTRCSDGAVLGLDGSVFVRTSDHRIFRCDPNDGHVVYSRHLGKDLARGPVVASDGAVFVTDWDLQMHALNPDGSTRWVNKGCGTATTFVIGSDDTVYVGRDFGGISALDPATGNERWKVIPAVGTSLENMRPIITVADSPKTAASADPHAHIYAACDGGFVYSLDARNGNLEWTSRQTRWPRPQPVVMPDGTIAAGADDYNVYGLDPSSGTVLWKWPLPHHDTPRPTVDSQGRIFCRGGDGTVRMADPALRFEQAARAMAEAEAVASPADAPTPGPVDAAAGVKVEDSWVVIGGVRIPRHG